MKRENAIQKLEKTLSTKGESFLNYSSNGEKELKDQDKLENKLINKPDFNEGDRVKVVVDDNLNLYGRIVGKSINYIIDMWIIQCDQVILETYPFTCFTAPHPQIERIK